MADTTQPGVDDGSALAGALRGAAFGFVAYATHDLTNQATLRNWPTVVTVVDMAGARSSPPPWPPSRPG